MTKRTRGIFIAIVLTLLILRMPIGSLLALILWLSVEAFVLSRRFGRNGHRAFRIYIAACVLFLSIQGYTLWVNLQIISQIEARGASSAAMSGYLLPGSVNYISLGTNVGDEELESILALEGLDSLEYVVANGSPISDTSFLKLRRFSSLQHIYLSNTHVTENGVSRLEKALPNCVIVFDADD